MTQPNFFILGAPKCGTTALASYLAEHPAVYMCPIKEPFFYDKDLPKPASVGERTYRSLFSKADPSRHLAVGEASTSYLYSKEALPGILRDCPGARFIVMLRPPADLVRSWHSQMVFSGQENIRDFRSAWEAEGTRKEGKNIPLSCAVRDHLFYSEWGKLGSQVERLLGLVPRERVLFLLLEEMSRDPAGVYAKVLDFLGLPPNGRTDFPRLNEAKGTRSLFVQRLFRLLSNWSMGLQSLLGTRKHFGLKKLLLSWNQDPAGQGPLDPAFRAQLTAHYLPEVEKLSRLIDRDLSHWMTPPPPGGNV